MLGFFPLGAAPLGGSGDIFRARGTGSAAGVGAAIAYAITDVIGTGIKRSGICFPSYGRSAVWSSGDGFLSDFPVANLSLIDKTRRVAVRSAVGATVIDFVLPAAQSVDFIALVHHNASKTSGMSIQLSSGTDPTADIVHMSGALPIWGNSQPVAGYLPVRPYRLSAPVTVRSGRITLTGNAAAWEMGAVEIGQFWSWTDVGVDRSIGIGSRSVVQNVGAGADHATLQWGPRVARGSRAAVDQTEVDERLVDFHRTRGQSQAFVWCWDADDSVTWPRESFLARNRSLAAGVVNAYLSGQMTYDFGEHLG